MPRCDVKHWPHRPARSESSEGDIEANALLFCATLRASV
jgi:hypothetical protein